MLSTELDHGNHVLNARYHGKRKWFGPDGKIPRPRSFTLMLELVRGGGVTANE
jgi:hypothetical protein